jgi:hypothetical protein
MKIWRAYSSEHSARLKIIGTFETITDARQAAALLNRLLDPSGSQGSLEELLQACREGDLSGFSSFDVSQLRLFRPIYAAGTEIRLENDGTEIQALLKVLIYYGAKVEVVPRPACSR